MSEFFGGTFVLVSFVLFWVCVFALFKPLKTIKLGSRKRAAAGIGVSFVLFMIGGTLLPKSTPEEQAERDANAQRAATESVAKSAEDVDQNAAAASATAEREKAELTTAVKGMWTQVTTQLSSCDQAGEYVSEVAGRRNPNIYDLYEMVTQAETLCRTAASNVGGISVPNTVPREFRNTFRDSFRTCRDAYYMKSSAYRSMGRVLDGDARPSAVNEAREASRSAQAGTMLCAVGFLKGVTEAGLPIEAVMGEEFAAED